MDGTPPSRRPSTSPTRPPTPTEQARARATLGHHIMLRVDDERTIALSPADHRRAARILLEHGEPRGLLAFRVVGCHVHILAICDRIEAGKLARAVAIALRKVLGIGCPFSRARIKPIADHRHLESTFWYVLRQEKHHRVSADPLHDGSCLPDLIGARVTLARRGSAVALGTAMVEAVAQLLPRVQRRKLVEEIGGAQLDAAIPTLEHLGDAAAAAFGLADITTRSWVTPLACRAAAHAARGLGTTAQVATQLAITTRSVQRHLLAPAPEPHILAVTRQLRLRALPRPTP
jgi:hypothetical protein